MKFAVKELLRILEENRSKHRAIFLEAQEGYRTRVIAELNTRLVEATAGQKIQRFAHFREPIDQTREYDRAIRMLQMCTESEVELDSREFGQLVMDQWDWKQDFLFANSAYSATAAALSGEE